MADIVEALEDTDYCWSSLSRVLIKGVQEGTDLMVYLEASNENLDQDEESVLQKALMENKDYYLQNGVISYDHLHTRMKDPGMVIGEPIDVKFNLETRSTLVKGRLYEKNENAVKVWNNLQSRAKYGASVGGAILAKSKSSQITKVVWNDTAITPSPVNTTVKGNVQMVPFKEFCKSLMAGSGVDAAQFTGGRALTPEVSHGVDDAVYGIAKKLFDELLCAVNDGKVTSWAQVNKFIADQNLPSDVTLQITAFIAKNIPGLR
jgi:hypothetical protein